ncbi:MAG: type II toxin-antitoxin system RelE/ParE family toxin [Porticoccaceae bacterium]
MIKSFRHKGLKAFFETGSKAGIQSHHATKRQRQLAQLHVAKDPSYMRMPGWNMHPLTGKLEGHYAVSVNGNWRLIFAFEGENVVLVDYRDYH